jgi:hypothetical protein
MGGNSRVDLGPMAPLRVQEPFFLTNTVLGVDFQSLTLTTLNLETDNFSFQSMKGNHGRTSAIKTECPFQNRPTWRSSV